MISLSIEKSVMASVRCEAWPSMNGIAGNSSLSFRFIYKEFNNQPKHNQMKSIHLDNSPECSLPHLHYSSEIVVLMLEI